MTDFEKDYSKAQQYLKKSKVKHIQNYILDILVPYINNIQKENPNADIQEIEKNIDEDFFDFARTVFKSSHTFNLYMLNTSCQYFQSHPKKFGEIYQKLKNGEITVDPLKENLHTDNSFEDYLIQYVKSSMDNYDEICKIGQDFAYKYPSLQPILDDPKMKLSDKLKKAEKYFGKYISSGYERNKYMYVVNCYLNGLQFYLRTDEKVISEELKEKLTTSISSIAQQLKKLNLFDRYSKIELSNFKSMNLEEFIISNKHTDITNPQLLNNLSIQDLIILNSFWLNRYAKELENHAEALFTIKTLNLLPNILDGSLHISDINKDTLIPTLLKCKMLREPSQLYINKQQIAYWEGRLKPEDYTVDESNNFIKYSYKDFGKIMRSKYPVEYQRTFNDILPTAENNIEANSRLYSELICPVINTYDFKTEMLHSILCTLDKNRDVVNAGIIPDSISDDGTQIILNPNFVCIGIDSKFTFPVREHTKLPVLQDFMVSYGNSYVPIYFGIRDFTFPNGKLISAQQILPFTKEEQKFVKKYAANTPKEQQSNFFSHLYWLQNPSKVPEHHLSTITDSKGRSKATYVRVYVDLSSYVPGKPLQACILENGKYVPITETNIRLPQTAALDRDHILNGGEELEF